MARRGAADRSKRLAQAIGLLVAGVVGLVVTGESLVDALTGMAIAIGIAFVGGVFVLRPWLRRMDARADQVDNGSVGPIRARSSATVTIELMGSLDRILDLLVETLSKWPGRVTVDLERKAVRFRTGPTIWSFGEHINAWVRPRSEQSTVVEIESRPRVSTSLFDYGQNKRNVRRLQRQLIEGSPTRRRNPVDDSQPTTMYVPDPPGWLRPQPRSRAAPPGRDRI